MRPKQTTYEPTTELPKRRRALFPREDNNDPIGPHEKLKADGSDCCSPLLDSDSEENARNCQLGITSQSSNSDLSDGKSIGDYDILGVVNKNQDEELLLEEEGSLSGTPLSAKNATFQAKKSRIQDNTPTQKLESQVNPKLPKLTRKTNAEFAFSVPYTPVQPPLQQTNSIMSSHSDNLNGSKNSKVRTALFPESPGIRLSEPELTILNSVVVPPRNFYPTSSPAGTSSSTKVSPSTSFTAKTSPNIQIQKGEQKLEADSKSSIPRSNKPPKRRQTSYLCSRSSQITKRRFGQINAGVRHKIRKSKSHRTAKTKQKLNTLALKTALDILENSPLNEFLNFDGTSAPRQIQPAIKNQQQKESQTILKNFNGSETEFLANGSSETIAAGNSSADNSLSADSEPEDQDRSNRKFFKSSSRPNRGTVTINDMFKFAVTNGGKVSLVNKKSTKRPRISQQAINGLIEEFEEDLENAPSSKRPKISSNGVNLPVESDDFVDEPAALIQTSQIAQIIDELENNNKENLSSPSLNNNKTLAAVNAENCMLMSPTSQMCNMASGLAINSPQKLPTMPNSPIHMQQMMNVNRNAKKAINLTPILEEIPSLDVRNGQQTPTQGNSPAAKLFPVFYSSHAAGGSAATGPSTQGPSSQKNNNRNSVTDSHGNHQPQQNKKFRALAKDQMLLDAGQKKFGATQCAECKIVYHQGDPADEIMHLNYHNAGNAFRFAGWKNERVVFDDFESRIVQVAPGDPKVWWKKIKEVIHVVNRDLGYYDMEFNTENSQVFLYVKNRTIVGCLVAEQKTIAHRLLTTEKDQIDMCSEESYPIRCGVSRIWVSPVYRKSGIATALMNSLKKNFMYGTVLTNEDVAFSSPTEQGKKFGNTLLSSLTPSEDRIRILLSQTQSLLGHFMATLLDLPGQNKAV